MLIERMRKRLSAERASFIEPCLPSPADKEYPQVCYGLAGAHNELELGLRRMVARPSVLQPRPQAMSAKKAMAYDDPLVLEVPHDLRLRGFGSDSTPARRA